MGRSKTKEVRFGANEATDEENEFGIELMSGNIARS